MTARVLGPDHTPYAAIGHDASVALARRFYDHMDAHEPALVALHRVDDSDARVSPVVRERFTSFLVQWLGGPDGDSQANGHPRLGMRHGRAAVDTAMRDAWPRCMDAALDDPSIDADARGYLQRRFLEVASFLRNRPDG